MAYNKKTWISDEIITKEALNNIENGIEELDGRLEDLEDKEVEVDLSGKQDRTDESLLTESKDVIGAINELFQSANNGKELIASAIGEPLNAEDTFSAMSTDINSLLSTFKTNMMNNGVTVESNDKFKSLIDKVDEELTKDKNTINSLNTEKANLTNQVNSLNTDKANLTNQINSLNSNIENTRNTLAGLMQESGYDITGNESIDSLLNLLVISCIKLSDIKQIACGKDYAFILKHNGSLWSCGYNISGQLGLGDYTQKTSFTQVTTNINNDVKQVACGSSHTVILKTDGSVWSCGGNGNGQLGLGNTANHNTFTQVTTNTSNVKEISCGIFSTFILKNDGSIWSCGKNYDGQLGLGTSGNTYETFTQVTANINNDVKQIACGGNHTFILKNDGTVWSCGNNEYGQLGLGNDTTKTLFTQVTANISNDVKQIACGYYHTFILKNDGTVWSCGFNNYGQLGLGNNTSKESFTQVTTNISNVKEIACGSGHHTFILKNDGTVYSCGDNTYGQLGLGSVANQKTFTQVTTNINNVKQIACGEEHTFILKNDSSIWSCGYNEYGQLGLGASDNTANHNTFTQVPRGI